MKEPLQHDASTRVEEEDQHEGIDCAVVRLCVRAPRSSGTGLAADSSHPRGLAQQVASVPPQVSPQVGGGVRHGSSSESVAGSGVVEVEPDSPTRAGNESNANFHITENNDNDNMSVDVSIYSNADRVCRVLSRRVLGDAGAPRCDLDPMEFLPLNNFASGGVVGEGLGSGLGGPRGTPKEVYSNNNKNDNVIATVDNSNCAVSTARPTRGLDVPESPCGILGGDMD